MHLHGTKIIPLFITNALEDKPLPLYGDGLNVRDWLYVTDNCEAIDLVFHKGLDAAIKEARQKEPLVLDGFHDSLTAKLYGELKSRGKI